MPRVAVLVVLLFSSRSGVLRAQSTNASITGHVTDPNKAVIVDAKVAAINAGTNVRYEGATSDSGDYYLTNLPPGLYRISVKAKEFSVAPQSTCQRQDGLGPMACRGSKNLITSSPACNAA